MTPRTLYIRRDVLNAEEIRAWAKSVGIDPVTSADDMHVTVAYSKTPMDWNKMGDPWGEKIEIDAGGPRAFERFGAMQDVLVLAFSSHSLYWRNREVLEYGGSWDFPEYQPHITLRYDFEGEVPAEPYRGRIVLGPEIFEEIDDGWRDSVRED